MLRWYHLEQWVWKEQLYLRVRYIFSAALQADKFFDLLLVGFSSICYQFLEHWLASLWTGLLKVHANLWFLAIFQLADCWCCAQRCMGQEIFSENQIDDATFTSTCFTYSQKVSKSNSRWTSSWSVGYGKPFLYGNVAFPARECGWVMFLFFCWFRLKIFLWMFIGYSGWHFFFQK